MNRFFTIQNFFSKNSPKCIARNMLIGTQIDDIQELISISRFSTIEKLFSNIHYFFSKICLSWVACDIFIGTQGIYIDEFQSDIWSTLLEFFFRIFP